MAASAQTQKTLLDAEALSRTLQRIAHEIVERNADLSKIALVGIHTRGVPLAQRLRGLIAEYGGTEVGLGTLYITFYRDDLYVRDGEAPVHPQPVVPATSLDFGLEGMTCILVDDVLYTGRTIRAAIEALFAYGRPERVQLACLVDRGHRELPILILLRRQEPPDLPRGARPRAARRGRRGRRRDSRFHNRREGRWAEIHTLARDELLPPKPPERRHLDLDRRPRARRRRTAAHARRRVRGPRSSAT